MSDEITNGAAKPTEAISGPTFTIEKIYIKDVSFEARIHRQFSMRLANRNYS